MGKSERHFGTNDEWCTSPVIWTPLVEHFGGIGLDPCSNLRSSVPARTRVLKDTPLWMQSALSMQMPGTTFIFGDGLEIDWSGYGLIFLNVPFSGIGPWAKKMVENPPYETVFLGPARTGAAYYQNHLLPYANARCFISRNGAGGRIYEVAKGIPPPYAPPWHSLLLYSGPRPELFKQVYSFLGRVEVVG